MIVSVYGDGGLVRINPSPWAGTWAWCHVDDEGERVAAESGLYVVAYPGLDLPVFDPIEGLSNTVEVWEHGPIITNNQMEFVALVRGLAALPPEWFGTVCSDSKITLARLFDAARLTGIPQYWIDEGARAIRRLGGRPMTRQLDGHPTKAQLEAGVGKRGHDVSLHNQWCDDQCTLQAGRYWQYLVQKAANNGDAWAAALKSSLNRSRDGGRSSGEPTDDDETDGVSTSQTEIGIA